MGDYFFSDHFVHSSVVKWCIQMYTFADGTATNSGQCTCGTASDRRRVQ